MVGKSPKTVVLDLDDFSLENNNFFYLDKLKSIYPKLKVSLFTIPFDAQYYRNFADFQREEIIKQIKKRLDWIELIPHGLTHANREFESAKYKDMKIIFRAIRDVFAKYDLPYVKGFKAPQWLYNQSLVDYLDYKGWFLATDRNQPDSLKAKRNYVYSHSIDEPYWLSEDKLIKLHGHISLPSKNNLPDNILNLMKIPKDADFKFVSEVV